MFSRHAAPFVCVLLLLQPGSVIRADVRDRAVVSLTFDDSVSADAGTVADSAKAGAVADNVSLTGSPTQVPSAFNSESPGQSLILNPDQKQQVVVASSPDISRGDAITVSGLFASLHPLTDEGYRGLFAKRSGGPGNPTNYGINFRPAGDVFQVYVNDGTGYKVANYSVKSSLGFRRRVHLAMAIDTADATGSDADADIDDLRVRLFVNGVVATPTSITGGFAEGPVAWLTDISLAKCVSDTPLTIGSSFVDGELMRLITDDIHIFAEALSDEDAAALFKEVAGSAAQSITDEATKPSRAEAAVPVIGRIDPPAVRVGQTQRVTVYGRNLAGARLHTSHRGLQATPVADGSNDKRAIFDVMAAANILPGRFSMRCVTSEGVSNSEVVAVDNIGAAADGTFSESAPAEVLPVAVSGLLAGTEQKRLWFRGKAGQRIVAEAEARRIGSKLDPVVEIHTASGSPLALQWQQSELSGDARTSVVLPADGLYYAEIHDLQFQAPGNSTWRLIVGDLPPSAISFPLSLSASPTSLRTLGSGESSEALTIREVDGSAILESGTALLPLPPLELTPAREVVEPMDAPFPADPVDATFTTAQLAPLAISGRISQPKERDSITLTVTPGQSLHCAVAARRIHSSLRPRLTVLQGEAVVAASDGETGANDPTVSFVVPDGVTQLTVRIEDIGGKGSPAAAYRLELGRTDRTAFLLAVDNSVLQLPDNGSVPLRVNVTRQSPSFRYTGPIHLSLSGASGLDVIPNVIPASEQNQSVIVMLTRSELANDEQRQAGQAIVLTGSTEGLDPPFHTTAIMTSPPTGALTQRESELLTGPSPPVPATLTIESPPPVLFRGATVQIPVRVLTLAEQPPTFVRFELMSTEPDRKEDPNKADSPLKPKVRLDELAFSSVSADAIPLSLHVPLDTPSSTLDIALSADFVSQPLAAASGPSAWSAPMTLAVDNAATFASPAEPFKAAKGATATINGTVARHVLFTDAITVELTGLPDGFKATPATIAAGESAFSIPVEVPASAAGEVPNVTLTLKFATGAAMSAPVPIRLLVE